MRRFIPACILLVLLAGAASSQQLILFKRAPPPAAPSIPAATSRWEGDISGSSVADTVGSNGCTTVNTPTDTADGIDFEADTDEYMHCGTIGGGYDADVNAITWCGVVNIESFVDAPIFGNEWTGFPKGWTVRTTTGSDILFQIHEISAGMRIETTTALSTATVYHICVTAPTNPTASTAAIYVNGSAVAETTVEDDLGAADADVTTTNRFAATHTDVTNTADMTLTVGTYWHTTELTPTEIAAQCVVDQTYAATVSVTVTCP